MDGRLLTEMPVTLSEELFELSSRYADELGNVAWASEADRWNELVFCVVNAFLDDPLRSRELVDVLVALQLGNAEALARAGDPASEAGTVLRYVLQQHGLEAEAAGGLAALLCRLGNSVSESYQGKIQRFLRVRAEAIRDDLLSLFGDAGMAEPELRRAVTHWLQNGLSLPLSVDDAAVRAFCEERGIGRDELDAAADEIDFNLALVDDLIRLDSFTRQAQAGQ